MTNQQHVDGVLRKLEKDYGADVVYDFFSGLYDGVVLGHTSHPDDNPHVPHGREKPAHDRYKFGAATAEKLLKTLGTE